MTAHPAGDGHCDPWHGTKNVPELDRLHYYYGQMLGPRDFQAEQDYFRNKLKLHNRCLHGHGVVCGLRASEVEPPKNPHCPDPPAPEALPAKRLYIKIGSGMALDAAGNELVVRDRPDYLQIDVWKLVAEQINHAQRDDVLTNGCTVYVSLCYEECKFAPQRIVDSSPCVDMCSNYETYARLRDSVCVKVSLKEPAADDRCSPCCQPYEETCVLLARIDHAFSPAQPPEIHNEVRRPVGLYHPTTITGVNWQHGATYDNRAAEKFLRRTGLTIRFSRDVLTATLRKGVIDVWTSDDYFSPNKRGEWSCLPVALKPIKSEMTREITFTVDEDLNSDDRILIIVRTDFILDACCQPVDGNHVGGMVPLIGGAPQLGPILQGVEEPIAPRCKSSKHPFRRYESGNGVPGGTFESWFFTGRTPDEPEAAEPAAKANPAEQVGQVDQASQVD